MDGGGGLSLARIEAYLLSIFRDAMKTLSFSPFSKSKVLQGHHEVPGWDRLMMRSPAPATRPQITSSTQTSLKVVL